jgi:hypothetical protein
MFSPFAEDAGQVELSLCSLHLPRPRPQCICIVSMMFCKSLKSELIIWEVPVDFYATCQCRGVNGLTMHGVVFLFSFISILPCSNPHPNPSPLKKDLDANGGWIFGELNGRIENKETKF